MGGVVVVSIGSPIGSIVVPPVTGVISTTLPPGPVKGGVYGSGSPGVVTGSTPIVTVASVLINSASATPVA